MPTPTITRRPPYHRSNEWALSSSGLSLQHRGLVSFQWLVHGFSLRHHPTSGKELDLGSQGTPSSQELEHLRSEFTTSLSGSPMPLVVLRQYHSVLVHCLDRFSPGERVAEGDALITRLPRLLLAVQVADCLPVLIADEAAGVVAAVHAGWRGLLGGIVPKTVKRMQSEYSCNPQHCVAVIGPCIGPCCYQVGNKLAAAFEVALGGRAQLLHYRQGSAPRSSAGLNDSASHPTRATKYLDLPAACRCQLEAAGLQASQIFSNPPCTSCQRDIFFSYRADQGTTGRMLATIGKLG